jgi:LysM repeat protein
MFKVKFKSQIKVFILCFSLFSFNAFVQADEVDNLINSNEYTEKANTLLKTLDANKDNKLSPNEVNLSFRLRRFQYVDKNQDGYLDQTELTDSYQKSALAQAQKSSENQQNKPLLEKIVQKINPPVNSNSNNNQSINNAVVNLSPGNNSVKDSGLRYKVEPGDSLFSIAKRYNIIDQDLMKINQIDDATKLPINKVLIIPASQKNN